MTRRDDVPVVQTVLTGESADAVICLEISELCRKISDRVEAAVISGDALSGPALRLLSEALDSQPDWSDLPIIIAVAEGADSPAAVEAVRTLGNVFVLAYPFTPQALKNTLLVAFRSRERQRWIRDLTSECRQSLEALKESRDRMEQKVEERTAELAERTSQLRRLTGDLIISEQRERQRLAAILHDHLQQVLVSAKYRAASLSRTEDPMVKVAVEEIEGLLGEAIEASRSLTSELIPPVVHESGLRTGMEWLASFMAAKYDFAVKLSMKEDFRQLDENTKLLLFEATRELLVNAQEHGKAGEADVSVRRAGDSMIQIEVADRGAGFDPAALKQSGFGLLRIRHRLEMIGGRLGIESSPGKGSRITLAAPLPIPEPLAAESGLQAEIAAARKEKPVGSMVRILIADDHAVMRQSLSTSLGEEPDFTIVGEAADGKAALEKARALHPDVILMDLGMPKMSGLEATRIINAEMPDIRVIGLSMFEEKERANAMIEAGAVAYLSKSCSVDTLTSTIRRCAGKREMPVI